MLAPRANWGESVPAEPDDAQHPTRFDRAVEPGDGRSAAPGASDHPNPDSFLTVLLRALSPWHT